MFSKFFIERPIFANVIAIVTVLVGVVSLFRLPIEQYPEMTPPTIQVVATYPGANAEVLSDTVAGVIEQEVNGVEGMIYMSSTSASNGVYTLTVTFEVGTDLDQAQVLVQNRIAVALPRLPQEVQRLGVTAQKQSMNIILAIGLTAPGGEYDDIYLSNYATLQIKDVLSRIPGVGNVQIFGGNRYGMRIWINPEKLKTRGLTTADVVAAINEQNVQVAAGQVGQRPADADQNYQYTVTAPGRFTDPEEFRRIIVKSADDPGSRKKLTRIADIADVELGSQSYDSFTEIDGVPAVGIGVFPLPGANALDVAHAVEEAMKVAEKSFPPGLEYSIPFNPTEFVEESIWEVYKTLFEAGVLVLIVILVFLQDWRAVLIPATTVPVTIIGAFMGLDALGYSVNTLTLFGLVLAIGIVVDDAIVIVENAVHHIDHDKVDAKTATIRAMNEVTGPVIGITLVLMAVFLPTIFLEGITGQMYRQFALTIAITALISALNAVTLKPAQCAVYLRPTPARKNLFYRGFNAVYDVFEAGYSWIIRAILPYSALVMVLFAVLAAGTAYYFAQLPTSFLPQDDQGYAIVGIQLDDAASLERTQEVTKKVNAILEQTPGVEGWFTIGGQSLLDQATVSNAAMYYLTFEPFEERTGDPRKSLPAILGHIMGQVQDIPEAVVFVFPPPAIMGLGTTGGFELKLQDRQNAGPQTLQQVADSLAAAGNGQPGLVGLQTSFRAGTPQLYVDVDPDKAKGLGVPMTAVYGTLQASLGSLYVNDFNKFGRTWQVQIQADQRFRRSEEDILRLQVRNDAGQMVPLSALATVKKIAGPQIIGRYNLFPAATINGSAAPGTSSGTAMTRMEQLADGTLPSSMGYEWSGLSFQEKKIGGQSIVIFGMAVVMVYLVLAAQYESWFLPAAVILVVPLALMGTVAAVMIRGMDNNVYTQIGIVLIIALASKNAILIVEFARDLHARGRTITEAAAEAARLRFRPILMTSFAFILGIVPLVRATGAGAAGRQSLGTAVFGGMIAATFMAVLFVPVFYVVMQGLSDWWTGRRPAAPPADAGRVPGADAAPDGDGHGPSPGNGHAHPAGRTSVEDVVGA